VIAGAVSSAIANPTDVLKVRMQVQGSHGNVSLIDCFKDVYTHEGISGLWRVLKCDVLTSKIIFRGFRASVPLPKEPL
jgi:hypothetical protein